MKYDSTLKQLLGKQHLQAGQVTLSAAIIETVLGPLLAIADDTALFMLSFVDGDELEQDIQRLQNKTHAVIIPGRTAVIVVLEKELKAYFAGRLQVFTTPVRLLGSPFQKQVWKALNKIPYAQTRSYRDIAVSLKNPLAVRAVGGANGANPFVIVVPCHRVINADGQLGGYSSGLSRKVWLLGHERTHGTICS